MKINIPALLVVGVLAGGVAVILSGRQTGGPSVRVSVKVPDLSKQAEEGRKIFEENCLACHGPNASGSENGPPLVHKIYEPSHHGDQAFFLAVGRGVRAHHWNFGNMDPVPDVLQKDVSKIVSYVRELQRANGIY